MLQVTYDQIHHKPTETYPAEENWIEIFDQMTKLSSPEIWAMTENNSGYQVWLRSSLQIQDGRTQMEIIYSQLVFHPIQQLWGTASKFGHWTQILEILGGPRSNNYS